MEPQRRPFVDGPGLVILLGALTAFDPLTIDLYLPAFGAIRETFGTTIDRVELSVSTFFVGMALGQLFYGPLADRFGRKKPLLAGMALYLLATIGCAFAPTIEVFIGFRLLQALGGCAGMVITRAVVRDLFDKQQVAAFLSNLALVMGLAPIVAPSIGAVVNEHFGWRVIFFGLAGANILALTCIAIFLPETGAGGRRTVPVSGANAPAGASTAEGSVEAALGSTGSRHSAAPSLIGAAAAFDTVSAQGVPSPTVTSTTLSASVTTDLRLGAILRRYFALLRNRAFVGYLIPDTALRAGMFAYIAGSPFVFIELFGIPANHYGWVFGLNGLGLLIASQINRRLLRRFTPEAILRVSVRVAALAAAFVFVATSAGAPPVLILAALFIFLATLNFVGPNSLAGALASQGHQAGTASALYGCLQWSLATVSSLGVSTFHNGTAYPMTGTILFCGLLSLVSFQVLVPADRALLKR